MQSRARLFLLLLLCAAPPLAADGDLKQDFKKFGREVGSAGREIGHTVADLAKKVWYKGKKVSKPLLEDVQDATEKFWKKTLETTDKALESARDENRELKRKLKEDR